MRYCIWELLHVKLFHSISNSGKCEHWFTNGSGKQKSNLCCHSDQTYETFYLNCHMLNYLIQFSILEKWKGDSPKTSRIKQAISLTKVIKLMEQFEFSFLENIKSDSRKISRITISIYVARVIKLTKYFIWILTC